VKLAAAAIAKMQSAKDALPALLPIGLGQRGGEFDKVFMVFWREPAADLP
jgi:multiple sugar transport system substrate-binding protein